MNPAESFTAPDVSFGTGLDGLTLLCPAWNRSCNSYFEALKPRVRCTRSSFFFEEMHKIKLSRSSRCTLRLQKHGTDETVAVHLAGKHYDLGPPQPADEVMMLPVWLKPWAVFRSVVK